MSKKQARVLGLGKKIFQEETEDDFHPIDNFVDSSSQVLYLKLEQIKPNPEQPRKYFDETALEDLAQSILDRGLLQPVIVKRAAEGEFLLVAGERRFRAYGKARALSDKPERFSKIPAIVRDDNELEISLIENIQREDLGPIEEAEGLRLLADRFNYTHERLSEVVRKARTSITELLELNILPEEIKAECRQQPRRYPKSLLLTVARQKDPEKVSDLWKQIKEQGLTVKQARKKTKQNRGRPERTPAQIVCAGGRNLSKKIASLDLNGLQDSDKEELKGTFTALENSVKELLNSL